MKNFKLTPLQIEIVEHRLELGDAIYEVLADTYDDIAYTMGDVFEACDFVSAAIKLECHPALWTDLQREVFVESVEGSTYVDTASDAEGYPVDAGGISLQKYNAIVRAFEQLTAIVGGE